MIFLPRQAQDKHGENSKKSTVFLQEWCAFDFEKAYPKWTEDAFGCQLELYPHTGDDGKDMDSFENENVAYQPSNKATVEALHKEILLKWDNGLGPPPPVSRPP